jgi:hypothetical protein
MKRICLFLLVLALCLGLCACGNSGTEEIKNTVFGETTRETEETTQLTEPVVDIIGEWVSVKDNTYTVTFLEDGTCFYTGTLGSVGNVMDGMIAVGSVVAGEDVKQNDDGAENQTYQYDYDRERAMITIFSSFTRNYQVAEENGKTVIATMEKEIAFVREENYEEFHSVCVKGFYDQGREGRVELVYGETYMIQDGIRMTVHGWVQGEVADITGNVPLFLQITLENTSEKGIYVRNPGGVVDGVIKPLFSEIAVSVNVQYLSGLISWGSDPLPLAKRTNETMTDADIKLYLEPGGKEEYYLKLGGVYLKAAEQEPIYVVLTFDNVEIFYAISAVLAGE